MPCSSYLAFWSGIYSRHDCLALQIFLWKSAHDFLISMRYKNNFSLIKWVAFKFHHSRMKACRNLASPASSASQETIRCGAHLVPAPYFPGHHLTRHCLVPPRDTMAPARKDPFVQSTWYFWEQAGIFPNLSTSGWLELCLLLINM